MSKLTKEQEELLKTAASTKRADTVWDPKPGEGIVGTFVRCKPMKGKNDSAYLSVTIDTPDLGLRVVNINTAAEEDFLEHAPAKGDQVAFHYHGTTRTGAGYDMGVYTVAVKKAK